MNFLKWLFGNKKEKDKPDGTFQTYDENGNIKSEGWMPPDQLQKILMSCNAQKAYKVLIKGPWDEIKEEWWILRDSSSEEITLSNEICAKESNVFFKIAISKTFLDENDVAYASAYYQDGQLCYSFIKKRLWEKLEEIEKIASDTSLSSTEKEALLKKIINE